MAARNTMKAAAVWPLFLLLAAFWGIGPPGSEQALLAKKLGAPSTYEESIVTALRYFSKAVFLKALLQDGGRPEEKTLVEQALTLANIEDSTDCTKRLICELKRKPDPMWDERLIQKAVSDRVSFASPAVQFELAAEIGNKEGPKQCVVAFRRCSLDAEKLIDLFRQGGTSVDINDIPGYDCTVLFLWTKKTPGVNNTIDKALSDAAILPAA